MRMETSMTCSLSFLANFVKVTWCQPTTLLLVWTTFFGAVLWYLRQRNTHLTSIGKEQQESPITPFKDVPSPMSLPLLGHIFRLGKAPHLVLTEWAKKYGKNGKLLRIKMGFQDALVISGLDAIRNAAVKQSIAFAGRPNFETSKLVCEGLSLTFSNYSTAWNQQKTSAQAAMSLYTTGRDSSRRSIMETSTTKHANNLVEQLLNAAALKDSMVTPREYVLLNVSNSICTICFGKLFDVNDPKLKKMLSINRNFDQAMGASQVVNFWPILKHFPLVGRAFKNLQIYMGCFWDFVSSLLESHWATYDDDVMRDITDCLYHESEKQRNKRKNNNEIVSPFTENNRLTTSNKESNHKQTNFPNKTNNSLYCNGHCSLKDGANPFLEKQWFEEQELDLRRRIIYAAGDIFGAGFDTFFSTIDWAIIYMATFPNTQDKLREEVCRVLTSDVEPSFHLHGTRCSYTLAWMYELLRHTSLVPLLLPHATTEETVLENCQVPKGVIVYFNAWQVHHDPNLWDDPDNFHPERFLKEQGDTYVLNNDQISKLLCWGVGRRRCLGEALSKHQIFIFLTTIVRRCRIEQSRPGIEPALPWPFDFGLTIKPKPYRVKITPF